jgi:hypothetical protein
MANSRQKQIVCFGRHKRIQVPFVQTSAASAAHTFIPILGHSTDSERVGQAAQSREGDGVFHEPGIAGSGVHGAGDF